jgi:hypothetical protein
MKMVKIMKLLLLLMVFVKVYIHFRMWSRIPSSYGSGSRSRSGSGTSSGSLRIRIHNTGISNDLQSINHILPTFGGCIFLLSACNLSIISHHLAVCPHYLTFRSGKGCQSIIRIFPRDGWQYVGTNTTINMTCN